MSKALRQKPRAALPNENFWADSHFSGPGPFGDTSKVGRSVRAARALPPGDPRVWTERARPFDNLSRDARRDDLLRRHTFLHPLLERGDRVERGRAGTAAA